MRRPLIFFLIAFAGGIIAGSAFSLSCSLLRTLALVLLVLILISLKKQWLTIGFCFVVGLVFLSGFFNIQKQFYFQDNHPRVEDYAHQGKKTLEGIVVESPVAYPDKNVLTVRCLRVLQDQSYSPVSGTIRLSVPTGLNFNYGDFIRFKTSLRKIENFNNPGCFNYQRLMNLQGIFVSGFIHRPSDILFIRNDSKGSLKDQLESFRASLKKMIRDHSPSPQRYILEAMTLGSKKEIPAEIRDSFSKTGTSHILSISGLHISMVAVTFFLLFFLVLKSSEYLMLKCNIIKLASFLSFALVITYAFIAGMGVTVMRATLMAFIFLMAILSGKQKDLYNTLALAALVILLIAPEALFDISFQLSFMSVLSIIYIVPRLNQLIPHDFFVSYPRIQSVIRYFLTASLVCIAATLGTLPIIAFYFDRVSLVTLIANLIAVPLLGTLTLAVAMFFILSAPLSPMIAGYFIQLASWTTGLSVCVIDRLAMLPWSSVVVTKPTMTEIIVFYLLIILFFEYLETRRNEKSKKATVGFRPAALKFLLILMVFFFVADFAYFSLRDKLSSDLKVTVIDVGQGNATLIQFPGGQNMMIDGGGFSKSTFDIGKGVIAQVLYHKRIKSIRTAVVSHAHPDHLSGLIYILNHFNVQSVWENGLPVDPELSPRWEEAIRANHIQTLRVSDRVPETDLNGVKIKILWPPDRFLNTMSNPSYDATNDASLVVKITLGKISFLIPGDISSAIEKKLVDSGADIKSDILLMPHHGSNHSSIREFIRAVSPRIAIASAGKHNAFGHPHPSVLQRYQEAGVKILRTDQQGAITMRTDGKQLQVDTYIKNN
jgi:competence protein ComEC